MYGLNSSGAALRAFLAENLDDIGFKISIADPDVQMRLATNPNGDKGENFQLKARFVADSHKSEAPSSITYSMVVSSDSARIYLTIAALNDLDALEYDVYNTYI